MTFCKKQGFDIYVGLNPVTLLTSGTLGFPGVALLYGIEVTKFCRKLPKFDFFTIAIDKRKCGCYNATYNKARVMNWGDYKSDTADILSIAVVTDVQCMKISNRLIVCGLIWGLVLKIWGNGYVGILYFILNITIPVVLLFLLFQMHALGAGDIKLFSLVGSF